MFIYAVQSVIILLMHTCRAALTSYNQSSTECNLMVCSPYLFHGHPSSFSFSPCLLSMRFLFSLTCVSFCLSTFCLHVSLFLFFPLFPFLSLPLSLSQILSPGFHNNTSFIGELVRRTRNLRPSSGFLK